MNILFNSVGRRAELLKCFRKSLEPESKIVAVDNSKFSPGLYFADKSMTVPLIRDEQYIPEILRICEDEKIEAITTLIDPEILVLAENRKLFEEKGILVLSPEEKTAGLCFDKFRMYEYLTENGLNTVRTWDNFEDTVRALESGKTSLPVFVKPRRGSGSVGARRINDLIELEEAFKLDPSLIAQELMAGDNVIDLDADVYIDAVSHKPVSIFSKKKISTTIGGANKTISFKDEKLFDFIYEICKCFDFCGPIDMDFFCKDGEYYLSEINPRFGGAYLHAYGAGVDFVKMIENNVKGKENSNSVGSYEENVVMMMYDSVVIKSVADLI